MNKKRYARDFVAAIQRHQARVAVGPSTVRGQQAPGLADAARGFLADLPLRQFGVSGAGLFRARLDQATKQLMAALPKRGRSWGIARKLLNVFLRDALYVVYLREHFHLDAAERLFELPLDSITAKQLRLELGDGALPRWQGVKHLTEPTSDRYQAAASAIAGVRAVPRVHLDAYWWACARYAGRANSRVQRMRSRSSPVGASRLRPAHR